MVRRNHLLFIPPLQLAEAYAGQAADIGRREDAFFSRTVSFYSFCFEHLLPIVFGQAVKVILADGADGVNPQNMVSAGTKLTHFVVEWKANRPVRAPMNSTAIASFFSPRQGPGHPLMRPAVARDAPTPHRALRPRTLAPVAIAWRPRGTGRKNRRFLSGLK